MQISNWFKKKNSSHKHWLFFQKMDGIQAESELELFCASKTWLKRRKCVGKIRKGERACGEGEAMWGADGLKQNSLPFSAPSLNPHTLFSFLQPSQNIHRRGTPSEPFSFFFFLSAHYIQSYLPSSWSLMINQVSTFNQMAVTGSCPHSCRVVIIPFRFDSRHPAVV